MIWVSGWLVSVGDLFHHQPPVGVIDAAFDPLIGIKCAGPRLYTQAHTQNSQHHWLQWNADIVASHSGHFHSNPVCDSAVVFRLTSLLWAVREHTVVAVHSLSNEKHQLCSEF